MYEKVEAEISGKRFSLESGNMARQADGTVLVSFGDSKVLVTVVAEETEQRKFLPLRVDYEEKFYAGGKIPGGFIKREGRPSDAAILSARMTDRPIRPLFPDGYYEEIHIVVTVLSADRDHPPEVAGMLGASAALMMSPVPFQGPIAGVKIGRVNGEIIVNPTADQLEEGDMDITIAGTFDAVTMVEGVMNEIPEAVISQAIQQAHEVIKQLVTFQRELIARVPVEKREVEPVELDPALIDQVRERVWDRFEELKDAPTKLDRDRQAKLLKQETVEGVLASQPEGPSAEELEALERSVGMIFEDLYKTFMRRSILDQEERMDRRPADQLRPITVEVGLLPRAHGSALFTRGETQSLGIVTLGTTRQDEQIIDQMIREGRKRFMLHYNFPPFSSGEAGFMRGPGRREIGHGHLAENAVRGVLPPEEEFPYIIRIVSEILESNGSTSMASVCSASLALMDAGVPIRRAVAGTSMGLIEDKETGRSVILTDITGLEDRFGDMDFKLAGTRDGVTALQLDVKTSGISYEIMETAVHRAREARLQILDVMDSVIWEPRAELSPYAPVLEIMRIDPEKIGAVIGTGGRIVRSIIETTGVEIDIEDDGQVKISGDSREAVEAAKQWIEELTKEIEIGEIFEGKVEKTTDFGAFVELKQGVNGMIHISNLDEGYVDRVEDIVKRGDQVRVQVIGIDQMGRIDLRRITDTDADVNVDTQTSVREANTKATAHPQIEVGGIFTGTVTKTTHYGAFVKLENDITGLIHISELAEGYVNRVEDIVKSGDQVRVKLLEIDRQGRYNFRRVESESQP
ncbi:MAG: polyribonucleotide nucleotidyltransferase [Candidatus Bipolaricaulia bacterium]